MDLGTEDVSYFRDSDVVSYQVCREVLTSFTSLPGLQIYVTRKNIHIGPQKLSKPISANFGILDISPKYA